MIRRLRNLFQPITPDALRARMLHDAQLNLLEQQNAAAYHAAMVEMLQKRISELKPAEPVAIDWQRLRGN